MPEHRGMGGYPLPRFYLAFMLVLDSPFDMLFDMLFDIFG